MTTSQLATDSLLYLEVTAFYGRQMRAMDEGDADAWAQTFTEDGVFEANAHPAPQVGRVVIARQARAAAAQMLADGLGRRHWLGMLEIDTDPAGAIRVRSYAQMLQTTIGGRTELRISTTCDDVLERVDDELKVRHRLVRRDDIA